jgi:hypothetical protein
MLELTVDRGVARSIMNEVVRQCCGSDGGGGGNDDDDERMVDEMMMMKKKNTSKYHIVRMMVSLGHDDNRRRRMELVADANVGRTAAEQKWEGGSIFSISLALPGDDDNDNIVEENGDNDEEDDDVDENGNPINGKKHHGNSVPSGTHHHPILEQLVAAHELALATQREKASSIDGNAGELLDIFCDLSILPAPELCGEESNDQGIRMVRRVTRGRDRMHLSSTTGTTGSTTTSRKNNNDNSKFGSANTASKASATMPSSSSLILPSKKGKPTTAAAFFGSHQATSTTKKKDNSSGSKGSVNTKPERNATINDDESNTMFVNESPSQKENKANKSLKVKIMAFHHPPRHRFRHQYRQTKRVAPTTLWEMLTKMMTSLKRRRRVRHVRPRRHKTSTMTRLRV